MIVTTESIVLRSRKQGDSSRIVTLYTKEFGMVNVIAKGARQMRSPFASCLELFNHISAIFYKKEHRELHLLAKAETLTKMSGIQQSLDQLTAASKVAEILLRSIHEGHQDLRLFELLLTSLKEIAEQPASAAPMFAIYFSFHYASLAGFALQLPSANLQGRYVLNLSTGEVASAGSSSASYEDRFVPISAAAVDVLTAIDDGGIGYLPQVDSLVSGELETILGKYLRAHIDTLQRSKVF